MPRQCLIACALVCSIALSPLAGAGYTEALVAQADEQVSRYGGVTVRVEPRGFPREGMWEFAVTLESHSEELGDDLVLRAILFADGKPYRPASWQGSPPGGHHRTGILRFRKITPPPQTLELRIHRADETRPRVFSWQPRQRP